MVKNPLGRATAQVDDPNYERYIALADQFVKVAANKLNGSYPEIAAGLRKIGSVAIELNARFVERAGYAMQDDIDRPGNDAGVQHGSLIDMIAGALTRMGEHSYDGYPVSGPEVRDAEEILKEVREAQ